MMFDFNSGRLRIGTGVALVAGLLGALPAVGGALPAADLSTKSVQTGSSKTAPAPKPTPLEVPEEVRNQEVVWGSCGLPGDIGSNMKCATLGVPRDWNNTAEKVYIPLTVSLYTPPGDVKPQRAIAMNLGGPGGPSMEAPILFGNNPAIANSAYIIGFDPRGVRLSAPMDCGASPMSSLNVRSRLPELVQAAASDLKAFGDRCSYFGGRVPVNGRVNLKPVLTTEQTVKDLEFIRQKLTPVKKLDFVGYSAGTWMGAMYQAYFPEQTGRMVLDSVADFTSANWQKVFSYQPRGFERRFKEDFLPWVIKHDDVYHLGTTVEEAYSVYEKMRWIFASLEGRYEAAFFGLTVGVRFDPNLMDNTIPGFLYDQASFPNLASAMMPWAEQVRTFEMSNGEVDTTVDVNNIPGMGAKQVADMATAAKNVLEAPQTITAMQASGGRVTPMMANRLRTSQPAAQNMDLESGDAVFWTLPCNDTNYDDINTMMAASAKVGKEFPIVGYSEAFTPCAMAPDPARELIKPVGNPLQPVLLIQSEHDPATAYEGAWAAHTNYQSSHFIKVTSNGNHGIFNTGNACVDDAATQYLLHGTLPEKNAEGVTICNFPQAEPLPRVITDADPAAADAAAESVNPFSVLSHAIASRTPAQRQALLDLAAKSPLLK